VQYLKEKKPDSKDHAEALLKLGLIQAKLEKYDQAIGVLEEGAEIMALLELEDLQVQALNDLGVVLENATHYDQALNRFQSAADLSRTLNRRESLARQHMRMGRVYDLRMSQYAKAKTHYRTALKHYENLKQKNNMAQALLDAGRCDRLMGNFEGAADQYEQALDLLSKNGDALKETRTLAGILMEQANNQWFQARYQQAFKGQRRVYRMAKKKPLASGAGQCTKYRRAYLVDPGRPRKRPAAIGRRP
jgi:tetratricopeptide (TPR) repeat protein